MRGLAEFVMRGRRQAIIVALLASLVPVIGWVISTTIVGLVTLRKNATEGFWVLLCTALPSVALALYGQPLSLLYHIVYGSLLVWILAIALRQHLSWRGVLQLTMLIGIIAVIVIHSYHPNIVHSWEIRFTDLFNKIEPGRYAIELPPAELHLLIKTMARYATGTQVAFILLGGLSGLMLARWIQSVLYNPGGFRQEFYEIRLGLLESGIFVIASILSWQGYSVALDVLPVIILPFLIAGLSLSHYLMARTKNPWFWVIGFYLLLILSSPYGLMLVIGLAFLDSGFDFRSRLHAVVRKQ